MNQPPFHVPPMPPEIQIDEANRQRDPEAAIANDVREMEQLLRGRGWVTRRQLQVLRPEWTDRHIRRMASMSERIASAPGTPGYCLEEEVPVADLDRVGAALISQGERMNARGLRLLRLAANRPGDRIPGDRV